MYSLLLSGQTRRATSSHIPLNQLSPAPFDPTDYVFQGTGQHEGQQIKGGIR